MSLPKRLSRKEVYTSPWINLYVDRVELASGKIIEQYHQLDYPFPSVVILLHKPSGEVLFIRNLRYTTGKVEWELPAGRVDPGETPLQAAEREAREETGVEVHALEEMYMFHPANGMSNQKVHIFKGEVSGVSKEIIDTDEVESVHWKSPEEIFQLLRNREITDGISVLPLALYLSNILGE